MSRDVMAVWFIAKAQWFADRLPTRFQLRLADSAMRGLMRMEGFNPDGLSAEAIREACVTLKATHPDLRIDALPNVYDAAVDAEAELAKEARES